MSIEYEDPQEEDNIITSYPTQARVEVTVASTLALAANPLRRTAIIETEGGFRTDLGLGQAAVLLSNIFINETEGSNYEIGPDNLFRGDIFVIRPAAAGPFFVRVTEGI